MKRIFPFCILLCFALSVFAKPEPDPLGLLPEGRTPPESSGETPPEPTAAELLSHVVARFPHDRLILDGNLLVRKRRGVIVQELKFRMFVHWGGRPAEARYTILGEKGEPLEEMILTREPGKAPQMKYLKGDPLAPAKVPDLFESIRDTDVSWMDLTLSFLWWGGGSIVGKDRVRGYSCYVVDIPAPKKPAPAPASGSKPYSRVRLWIEEKIHVLLQAEGYGDDDKALRRLWVKSCKKIDDRWMIKDMEIQAYPAVHRTKLRIKEVRSPAPL